MSRRSRLLKLGAAGVAALLLAGLIWQWRESRQLRRMIASAAQPAPGDSGLWPHLFASDKQTSVVVADSCLSMLQHLTRRRVSLSDYISRGYPSDLRDADQQLIAKLQFTSLADVNIITKILRMDSRYAGRTSINYARNLETRDFNRDHHILLGSRWANPWGELSAESKNFQFEYDWERRRPHYRSKSPRPEEPELYFERGPAGASDEQYGVITLSRLRHGS